VSALKEFMKIVFAALSLMVLSTAAHAQIPHTVPPGTSERFHFHTGNDLLSLCTGDVEAKTQCDSYILGVVDAIGTLQSNRGADDKSFWKYTSVCLPFEANVKQVIDVVIKYLTENPEIRDQKASQIIIRAMIKTWGCPAK
jgi:hypothetical protein